MRSLTSLAASHVPAPGGALLHPHGAGNRLPLVIATRLTAAAALVASVRTR